MHDNTELILSLASNLSDGIVTINEDGRVISVNEAACSITGYSKGEMVGQSFTDLFPPQIKSPAQAHPIEKALLAKSQSSFESKPRGRELKLSILPADGKGKMPAVTVRAVAIIKSTNPQLTEDDPRSARIQMVGLFATGVAHDVNNDLTAIMCSIQFAHSLINQTCSKLREGSAEYKSLDNALTHLADTEAITKRTATLTKQLLAYARQKHTEKQAVNLNEAIRETLSLVNKLIGEKIEIEVNLAQLLPPVLAERSQIDRILTNLILNARDAMPTGGKIKIETSWVYLDENFKAGRPPWAKTGRYVHLSVSDTGKGMDEDTLKKIYDEFFTTKAKGTGLGLRTVYQIVKDNEGMIEAHSEQEIGTRFDIYLPPTEKRDSKTIRKADSKRTTLAEPQPRSDYFILVAEEKPHVLALMEEIINQAGYKVIGVGDGEKAVNTYRTSKEGGEAVSVALLDLGLPVIDGRTAKDEIRKFDPDAMVILTGSYDAEAGSESSPEKKDYEFLTKPFDGYKLLESIELALEKKIHSEQMTASQ
jgi:two-component system, cell cycle sensor histidine kinase and response regulator CckA